MKLRAPAVPLITVDPYFSVWSNSDLLYDSTTVHWTGKPNAIIGIANIDQKDYLFMGKKEACESMQQMSCEVDALSTTYTFVGGNIELSLIFTTPLLLTNLKVLSRPVSYLKAEVKSLDQADHDVKISIWVEEDLCLNSPKEQEAKGEVCLLPGSSTCARMGNIQQEVLNKAGDDVRIDWGYFYLTVDSEKSQVNIHKTEDRTALEGLAELNTHTQNQALFVFAYDDIYSLQYFGVNIKGYWVKESEDILQIIHNAINEYRDIKQECDRFSDELTQRAKNSGGEKYAELLNLAYRQAIAAHKLCIDQENKLLFISKECFSNGCAATVDVTYPSIPLFLLYNPKLIEGMLRPIFHYANTLDWCFDFAPHDVGTYPLINGQAYSNGTDPSDQMPVEECGNMIITVAAMCKADNDYTFAKEHRKLLTQWVEYLMLYGEDPDNQLCTDDFAGHLAHNCNLSVKAIMGIASFGIIMENIEGSDASELYYKTAKKMAQSWIKRASNEDGSYRLTFDQTNTFSMKYNMVWDKIFNLGIFPQEVIEQEAQSYLTRINQYGMPLDNRAKYTKSDWLVWSGALMEKQTDFETFIEPLWYAYHETESRVPMTDWYDTETAKQIGFQHRSVQGGLFIKLLKDQTR
jgi:hypothetical protein